MNNQELIKSYPHLTPQSEFSGRGQCVTTNIRKHLKKLFPGIKFSVKCRNYNCINVSYTDGPTLESVKSGLSIFDYGVSDSMTDYHGIESTDFTNLFDGTEYLFIDQSISDDIVKSILDRLNACNCESRNISFETYSDNKSFQRFDNYISGCNSYQAEQHFFTDFNDMKSAVLNGNLTTSEIDNKLNIGCDFDSDIVKQAIDEKLNEFYISGYIYAIQFDNINDIDYQKGLLQAEIDNSICKREGRETKQERETREYNEKIEENNKKLELIAPLSTEIFEKENRIDIKVKMPSLNKNCTLEENKKELDKTIDGVRIYELYKIITLTDDDYNLAGNNLMNCIDLWSNEYPKDYFFDNESKVVHFPVIKIINSDTKESFIVDTQGYTYARYVGKQIETELSEYDLVTIAIEYINDNKSFRKFEHDNNIDSSKSGYYWSQAAIEIKLNEKKQFSNVADFMAFKNKHTSSNIVNI